MKRTKTTFLILTLAFILPAVVFGAGEKSPLERTSPVQDDVRVDLVEYGIHAQSAHNMQSWKVALSKSDETLMILFIEEKRLLPATDPYSRQITISAGNFLSTMEERALELGYELEITLFPEGEFSWDASPDEIGNTPIAEIRVKHGKGPQNRPLVDAVSAATVKRNMGTVLLSEDEINLILRYDDRESIKSFILQNPDHVAELKPILIDSFRLEMETEDTLMESYDNTRINKKERDEMPFGLSYPGIFPAKSLGFMETMSTIFPLKPEAYGKVGAETYEKTIKNIDSYLFLITKDNSRTTQVQTGMVLQRMWMEAMNMGLSLLPASQPLQEYPEVAEYYERIHKMYASKGETVQMILAIGEVVERFIHSPRFGPEDIIVYTD
jgi:nitroreductase